MRLSYDLFSISGTKKTTSPSWDFYHDTNVKFNRKGYVVGNTVCIMYAEWKYFLDGRQGIRVEDLRFSQGEFPWDLGRGWGLIFG